MTSLTRMTEAGALGLHAVIHLAAEASTAGGRTTAAEIAKGLGASEAHLAKVLQRLSRAGIVESTRGPRGGFSLARDPSRLTLLEVYEALEGSLTTDGCLFGGPVCDRARCIMGGVVERVNGEIRAYMEKTTVDSVLCPGGNGGRGAERLR